jgi:hypothetical protein
MDYSIYYGLAIELFSNFCYNNMITNEFIMARTQMPGALRKIADLWDGMGTFERLNLILACRDLFLSNGLVTQSELRLVDEMHESEREYVCKREVTPIFSSLNIVQTVNMQTHRERLEDVLMGVFL